MNFVNWGKYVRKTVPFLLLAIATSWLARATIGAVLAKLGHPGAALDDTYIHFQYARAIAEGHPFRYHPGDPISTGSTSFFWPALLAVPYALGLHGQLLMWAAWAMSYVALAALAYEAYRLTLPLAGRAAGLGAGAMTLGFGGFAWCAASGMEVVPFAWLIAYASRCASEWAEASAESRTRWRLVWLVVLAIAAPFLRPEGALTSLVVGSAIFFFPRTQHWASRAEALVFLLAAIAPNLLLLALTGQPTSSTMQVKLLVGNPYYPLQGFVLARTVLANVRDVVGVILNGEIWAAEFLPEGGAVIACAGLVAIAWRGRASRRTFRAAVVIVLALTIFAPCMYVTFLWNRLRYLWPFATGWFVGLACFARALGTLAARVEPKSAPAVTALVAGAFAGLLAARLDGVIADVAQSASGIDRQQVALAQWIKRTLPVGALVGLNDAGAIAYFGDRPTFDIVGLTTPPEGRHWVAGPGSRLEHYERRHARAPASLPTYFAVYPDWMGCEPVLGPLLYEAIVTDATILGGQTKGVYQARYDHLGSGEAPWTHVGTIHDTIDVADLESEAEHGYDLGGARAGEQVAFEGNAPNGNIVVDGGRTNRTRERFEAHIAQQHVGNPIRMIARVKAAEFGALHVSIDGHTIGRAALDPEGWREVVLDVPANFVRAKMSVEVSALGTTFASFHWWFADAL